VAPPATDPGALPYNQDRAFVQTDATTGITTVCVCDGHGTYGAEAAQVAVDTLAAGSPTADAAELFAAADAAIRTEMTTRLRARAIAYTEEGGAIYYGLGTGAARGAPVRGGTTVSLLRIQPDLSLTAAHVGDSDIIFWDTDVDPGTVLMADHTPTDAAEAARIRASHPGTHITFAQQFAHQRERPVWTPAALGPAPAGEPAPTPWERNPRGGYYHCDVRGNWAAYVHASDNSEALAMTRALGDFNLRRHGISATPSVLTAAPPPSGTTRAIVVASDGVWDPAEYHEIRDLVRRPDLLGNAGAATAALLEWARARGRARFGAGADNMAVAVVYCFAPAPAPVAESNAAEEVPIAPCALHGEDDEPPALGYSTNSNGDYSTFAPLCSCPAPAPEPAPEPDPYMVHLWRVEDGFIANVAHSPYREATIADAERVRRNRHPDPADYERTRAAATALGRL
jgi:serine/threonine protein phosphatase PrpC